MMASTGTLVVRMLGDSLHLQQTLTRSVSYVEQFASRFKGLVVGAVATLGIASLGSQLSFGVEMAAQARQSQIAFEVMLGSSSRAKAMLAELKRFAADTPLEFTDLRQAAQTLLGFNVLAEKILPTLQRLGDVSGGDAQRFQQLALVFAQVSAAGKLTGGDLLQFINAGFNPLVEIANRTGKTIGQLRKEMERGAITIEMVENAFIRATGPGGRFEGLLKRQSREVLGLWSSLRDGGVTLLQEIGDILIEAFDIEGLLNTSGQLVNWLVTQLQAYSQQIRVAIQTLTPFIAAMGMLGVATLAYAAYQKVATISAMVFQAVMNPASVLKMAAGLALAGGAIYGMNRLLDETGGNVAAVRQQFEGVGQAAQGAEKQAAALANTVAGMAQVQGLGAFSKQAQDALNALEGWQTIREAQPELGAALGAQQLKQIEGVDLFPKAMSEAELKVANINVALQQIRANADQLGPIGERWTQQLEDQLATASGIDKAIADARRDLQKLQPGGEIGAKLQEYHDKGATTAQVRELERLMRQAEQTKAAQEEAKKALEVRGEGIAAIEKMRDEIDKLSGAATDAQLAMRDMVRKGLPPDQLKELEGLTKQRDELKELEKLRERSKQIVEQSQTPQQKLAAQMAELDKLKGRGLLSQDQYDQARQKVEADAAGSKPRVGVGAALAGSQEAVTSVLRAAGGGKSPAEKQLKVADNQLAEQKKTNELLADLNRNGGNLQTTDLA